MPGVASESGGGGASDSIGGALVPFLPDSQVAVVYPLRHGLKPPISRVSVSWALGNTLRVSVFRPPAVESDHDDDVGGKVLEVKLGGNGDGELSDAQWRRIAYGSVSPFALLQSRRNSALSLSKMQLSPSPYHLEWWEYVMEYSKDISSLLGHPKSSPDPVIEDPKEVLKVEEPTCLKAAWDLMEMFYADKLSQAWLPERLVKWLADYDSLLSDTQATVHLKLLEFQGRLVTLQVVEDDSKYWEVVSSALAVGWLQIVVKMLRLHGSYQLDQLGSRETENGLVETVAVLISKMPRLCPELEAGNLGECYKAKPDFMKAWERWRAQVTKLDSSAFWVQCDHRQTREGLKNLLQILLGNASILSTVTCNWMELYISHLLYIRPFTVGLESLYSLAQKCIQLKPMTSPHKLMQLIIGILGENTELILAECSRGFGTWMTAHAMEFLTAGSNQAEVLLHEERDNLGGISVMELHRLVHAQVLSSHILTWQIAPIYLISCMKQGMGLLEILLSRQPVKHNQLLIKNLEICRLYELDSVSSNIMKIAGIYHWKHGRKGSGVFWLQQARDEVCLNRIAQQLFDTVGKSISDESFKLMKNPSTPQRFWLPLLYDSLKLLNWQERPLLNVSQTNLLLNKLQELSMARVRPDFIEADLPPQALSSVRLALATNLGRAILEES
ncbi:hypothetical protein MANES_16G075300v8 [Manihot esculenta]|uniref:Uncharacterized protein n=1 Tax=Manihot esculenta TaxID=3983 RepID=A0ACB7G766_MANES|nr:hypothetical protein MANES_16G075300v8 [Manihot esculenta]